jgi:hypothetical protein
MGFIPDLLLFPQRKDAPARIVESACHFCAARPAELYQLPTFGLASPDEAAVLTCEDCYQQITFTTPRPAARVVLANP